MLFSLLAVGCPLLSTLVISRGSERIALSGSNGAAAGLFAFPIEVSLPFVVVVLLCVPLAAGEARIVELVATADNGT